MRTFTAVATREDDWWIVEVEGVGTTQGHDDEDAKKMAAGLVEAVLELDPGEFEVKVEFKR